MQVKQHSRTLLDFFIPVFHYYKVQRPSLISHLTSLLMPLTMTVIVPVWLLWNYESHAEPNLIHYLAGAALILLGAVLFISSLFFFISVGKGTLAPWDPTKKLVIRGPYRFCRNPMISGVFFIILGEAIYFWSFALFIWAILFFSINTIYFILKEEPSLAEKFGSEYKRYKSQVNRWVPKLKPYK